MKNQNTSFLRFGYFLWFILVFALIGCQQAKPSLTYQSLLDKPVQSRTQPASLSQKSTESFIQEGFVKIGYIDLRMLAKSCRAYLLGGKNVGKVCETNPESDPIPWLLRKGGEVGGDLIVIEFEKPYTEFMDMMGVDAFYENEFSRITAAVWRKTGGNPKDLL
ncbi:MAG: hypothetical protein O7F12_09785, partial [Nitrospirae bacterium]|nr:hypothetical protein [Nitrospirota bacterium]